MGALDEADASGERDRGGVQCPRVPIGGHAVFPTVRDERGRGQTAQTAILVRFNRLDTYSALPAGHVLAGAPAHDLAVANEAEPKAVEVKVIQ